MGSDPPIMVQLEVWQAPVRVTVDGFRPTEGCVLSMYLGVGAENVHSSLPIVFVPFANSFETESEGRVLAVSFCAQNMGLHSH